MFLHHQRPVAEPNAGLGILLDGGQEGFARDDWIVGIDQHPADHAFSSKFLDAKRVIFKGHVIGAACGLAWRVRLHPNLHQVADGLGSVRGNTGLLGSPPVELG